MQRNASVIILHGTRIQKMCLAIPAQITKLLPKQRAIANIGGVEKEISLSLVEEVSEGDYVILHVGYALTKLNEEEAKKTLELFAQMQATGRGV